MNDLNSKLKSLAIASLMLGSVMLAGTFSASTAMANRNEQCSQLRKEIKLHKQMLKFAVEKKNKQVIPVLIQVLIQLEGNFQEMCVTEV